MKLVALALACVACVACSACSAASPAAPDAAPSAPGDDAGDAGTGDEAAAATVDVSGSVVDSLGAPWASATVQVCSATVCTLGKADSAGAFSVAVPPNDHYHVIAHASPTDPRNASAGIGVVPTLVTSDTALASPVVVPVTGAIVSLHADAGAFDAAVTSDLTLSGSAADLAFGGDAYLAAVRLDASAWPAFSIPGETILAIWALNPWGTHATPQETIAVAIENGFGLAPGDTASVFTVDETTAELGAPSTATVSDDGATLAGATIDRITWIVLAH